MTFPTIAAFSVIIGMMGLFAWGRWRYDQVALVALLVSIVPADKAFSGFSDDIVIIVASALLVSAAVARSGVIERVVRSLSAHLRTIQQQVIALVGAVTLLSGFVKNIGALAMLMPIAFQLSRRTGTSPSFRLMPMSFGALLGGIVTLIGTSPNIIVSRVREQLLGAPYGMFDFTPVGAGIAVVGFIFLVFGWASYPPTTRERRPWTRPSTSKAISPTWPCPRSRPPSGSQ
jgi:di/tricarboxylate transporter